MTGILLLRIKKIHGNRRSQIFHGSSRGKRFSAKMVCWRIVIIAQAFIKLPGYAVGAGRNTGLRSGHEGCGSLAYSKKLIQALINFVPSAQFYMLHQSCLNKRTSLRDFVQLVFTKDVDLDSDGYEQRETDV